MPVIRQCRSATVSVGIATRLGRATARCPGGHNGTERAAGREAVPGMSPDTGNCRARAAATAAETYFLAEDPHRIGLLSLRGKTSLRGKISLRGHDRRRPVPGRAAGQARRSASAYRPPGEISGRRPTGPPARALQPLGDAAGPWPAQRDTGKTRGGGRHHEAHGKLARRPHPPSPRTRVNAGDPPANQPPASPLAHVQTRLFITQ